MPHTVNIERHKLNQSMYQKLKRYIMSKRKRELEEKAQDAYFKRLRREREERKRQTEQDTESLENTRKEISSTRKRIEELTSRRNELFQRLKQLASEETSLKEKQKSETTTFVTTIPTTQFGLESGTNVAANRALASRNSQPTNTPSQQQQQQQHPQHPANLGGGKYAINSNTPAPPVSLHGQHITHPNPARDSQSPHRSHHNNFPGLHSKNVHPSTLVSSNALPQQPIASLTNSSDAKAAAAAAAAAVAAHQHITSNDSMFPTTAAAAIYFNAISSLTNSSSLAAATGGAGGGGGAGGNNVPLRLNHPNFPNLPTSNCAEVLAALASAGLYALPTTLSANPNALSGLNPQNFSTGNRVSPATTENQLARDTITAAQSSVAAAAAAMASLTQQHHHHQMQQQQQQQQVSNLSKNLAHLPQSGVDLANSHLDAAKVCLAQLAAAATSSGAHNQQQQQQQQKAQQLLRSISANNPIISPLFTNATDLELAALVSCTTASSVSVTSGSPILPPAPVSYRGSITTGQSAQQIQLQQQQHQKQQQQQQHPIPKYPPNQMDYSSVRAPGLTNLEGNHNAASSYALNNQLSASGLRFPGPQSNPGGPNNLIMLNLGNASSTSSSASSAGTNHPLAAPGSLSSNLNALKSSYPGNRPNDSGPTSSTNLGQFNSTISAALSNNSNVLNSLTSVSSSSPVALAAVLAPYANDFNAFNYLASSSLAAFQQQQQQQQQQRLAASNAGPNTNMSNNASNMTSANNHINNNNNNSVNANSNTNAANNSNTSNNNNNARRFF